MSAIAFPAPDAGILARRDAIISGLAKLVAADALITSEDERRPYETDALTAYRRMPLAVVLPSTTREVAAVLRYCSEQGVPVVPRGAGTSLAGGAIPQEDAVVIGVSKMNRILAIDYANRVAKVLRARPVLPARLLDRRQYRDELGRRPLPEIRRHHQQRAWGHPGHAGWEHRRDRR